MINSTVDNVKLSNITDLLFVSSMRSGLIETVASEEVGETVVEMTPVVIDGVVLVRVGLLMKQNIFLLQGCRQHHGLLIVNIVIMSAVDQIIFLVSQIVQVPERSAGVVTNNVISWSVHVPLSVDSVIQLPPDNQLTFINY